MSDQDNQDNAEEQPKIIVDDDWKEQVEKEKAAAAAGGEATGSTEEAAEPSAVMEDDSVDDADLPPGGGQMPEASLEVHISMLFSQCMASLGQMPGPDGQPSEVNKPFAKHFIDTVEMLQEKTAGNVSEDEKKMMADVLHAMRMAFVNAKA